MSFKQYCSCRIGLLIDLALGWSYTCAHSRELMNCVVSILLAIWDWIKKLFSIMNHIHEQKIEVVSQKMGYITYSLAKDGDITLIHEVHAIFMYIFRQTLHCRRCLRCQSLGRSITYGWCCRLSRSCDPLRRHRRKRHISLRPSLRDSRCCTTQRGYLRWSQHLRQ